MEDRGGWDVHHIESGTVENLDLTPRRDLISVFDDLNHFVREVTLKFTSLMTVVCTLILTAILFLVLGDVIGITSDLSAIPILFAFYIVIIAFGAISVEFWKLSRFLKAKIGSHWEENSPPHELPQPKQTEMFGLIRYCLSNIFNHTHRSPQPVKVQPKFKMGLAQAFIGVMVFLFAGYASTSLLDAEFIPVEELTWDESNISFVSVVVSVIIGNIAGLMVLGIASASTSPDEFILFGLVLGVTSFYVVPAANNFLQYTETQYRKITQRWFRYGVLKPIALVYSLVFLCVDLFLLSLFWVMLTSTI